jgi:hypothetical protein
VSRRIPENPKTTAGPFTAQGKETALGNLLPPGQAAVTHGVRMADGVFLYCDRCAVRVAGCEAYQAGGDCALERQYIADRRAEVLAMPHLDAVLDGPAVSVLLWLELRLLRASRALAMTGETRVSKDGKTLEYVPLADRLGGLISTWRETLKALNLTPAGRKAMADDGRGGPGADLAAALRDLAAQDRAKAARTLDGECEEVGSDGQGDGADR